MTVLGVDIGTTSLKMGIFEAGDAGAIPDPRAVFSCPYPIDSYNDGQFCEIDPDRWIEAFLAGCRYFGDATGRVDAIGLSGTTPGLTPLSGEGRPLHPAILMLDQRSRPQADEILRRVGSERLLALTANLPVPGGSSLAGILWLRDERPEIFRSTACFGHSNTVFAAWLSGAFAIDPSSASLSGLYDTAGAGYRWNEGIASEFGIDIAKMPELMPADASPGRMRRELVGFTGMHRRPAIVIGGNDAVLAAFSIGMKDPGDCVNVNGTCEIGMVCLDRCRPSPEYNIRNHVLPDRWMTFRVMNAGGKAFEWFHGVFCSELSPDEFFGTFVPRSLDRWIERDSGVDYIPFLMGSRYSTRPLKGGFTGLTRETTREEMLAALVRSLAAYQGKHFEEVASFQPLGSVIHLTGGAVNPSLIRAKKAWMRGDVEYRFQEQSSMKGAAMLAFAHLSGR